MELGKHGRKGRAELEEKQMVTSQDSEAKPLTFTFVPSIGQLPTHFEVVDVSKFLVTIPEEPKDLSNQEIINKAKVVSDELSLSSGVQQDCVPVISPNSTQTVLQSLVSYSSKGEMQENDLFKAEFILITDSGDEDEAGAASINAQRPSNGYGPISAQLLAASHVSPGMESRKPPSDGHLPSATLSHSIADQQNQQALEEPTKAAGVTEGTTLDTHSEMCSPAQLRQQTEELCAVIDQVLQDPLTMVSTTLQRAAGRETRYANLYKSTPVVAESQMTKPGVIRPVLVKGKSAQQKEELYQPNPFKKYLEEISDGDIEQVSNSHSEGLCSLSYFL
uniref:Muscular LMNA interacting protein n=1 Tax=Phasianus colchicus TaxID=9054 RepID=A0A669QRH3_PHACC